MVDWADQADSAVAVAQVAQARGAQISAMVLPDPATRQGVGLDRAAQEAQADSVAVDSDRQGLDRVSLPLRTDQGKMAIALRLAARLANPTASRRRAAAARAVRRLVPRRRQRQPRQHRHAALPADPARLLAAARAVADPASAGATVPLCKR